MTGPAEAPSAGESFARRAGAVAGLTDARRVFVTARVPPEQIARSRENAARAAAGYSLVSWTGPVPDEYLPGFAAVVNAMSDAPRDAGVQAYAWDAQRIRERVESRQAARGSRRYSVAAVHDASGEMAAVTVIEVVGADQPEWAHQTITVVARQHRGHRLGMLVKVVARQHRGHRLGMLVKAAIHQWLAEAEPAVRRIVTWNAASNQHMIAINEALGYELLGPLWRSYELPVLVVRPVS